MSTISSISSNTSSLYSTSSTQKKERPDPAKLAADLFSKLDTDGQGSIDKTELSSALGQLSSTDSTSSDDIFNALDGDGDGNITKQELSDGIKKLADELHSQFDQARAAGGSGGPQGPHGSGNPPPPPPEGDDQGLTVDELKSRATEAASSGNTKAASDLNALVSSFDQADTDGDGKVTFNEAKAFKESQSTSTNTSDSNSTTSTNSTSQSDAQVFHRLMQLAQSYGLFSDNNSSSTEKTSNSISVA